MYHLICVVVIFLVDVRVTFDEFKQSMIGICDQKTIITTNPGYLLYMRTYVHIP